MASFRQMGIHADEGQIRTLLADIDEDGNGQLDCIEFSVMLHRLSTGERLVKHQTVSAVYDEDGSDDPDRHRGPCLKRVFRVRRLVWREFGDSDETRLAQAITYFTFLLILLSNIMFVVETLPSMNQNPDYAPMFQYVEAVCVIWFTIEFVCRLLSCPRYASFCRDLLNWVDLLAVLPWYAELATEGNINEGVVDVFRTFRLLRLFKLARLAGSFLSIMVATLRESTSLVIIGSVQMIIIITFSAVVYTVETGFGTEWSKIERNWVVKQPSIGLDNVGQVTRFESIPRTMYWCFCTMTTVGYGVPDVPNTVIGKLLAVLAAGLGLILLAVPISVISSNFQDAYAHNKKMQHMEHELRSKLQHAQKLARQKAQLAKQALEEKIDRYQHALKRNPDSFNKILKKDTAGHGGWAKIRMATKTAAALGNSAASNRQRESDAECELYLLSCFELIKSNQRNLLVQMRNEEESNRHMLVDSFAESLDNCDFAEEKEMEKQRKASLAAANSPHGGSNRKRGSRFGLPALGRRMSKRNSLVNSPGGLAVEAGVHMSHSNSSGGSDREATGRTKKRRKSLMQMPASPPGIPENSPPKLGSTTKSGTAIF